MCRHLDLGSGATSEYPRTVEQLGAVMEAAGIEGGTYWKWADETNDPKWTDPASVVKRRGVALLRIELSAPAALDVDGVC